MLFLDIEIMLENRWTQNTEMLSVNNYVLHIQRISENLTIKDVVLK